MTCNLTCLTFFRKNDFASLIFDICSGNVDVMSCKLEVLCRGNFDILSKQFPFVDIDIIILNNARE